jgi:hypothetical protein
MSKNHRLWEVVRPSRTPRVLRLKLGVYTVDVHDAVGAEALAKKLAATSEMLEALKGAQKAFERIGCAAGDELKLDAVKAAIAKAEGES